MSALFTLEAIDKNWLPISRGQFEAILGGACAFYLDRNKAPRIAESIAPMVADFRHDYWPEEYPAAEGADMDFFEFSDYPREERIELLRAIEALLRRLSTRPTRPWVELDAWAQAKFHRRFRGSDRTDARGTHGDIIGGPRPSGRGARDRARFRRAAAALGPARR